MGIPRTIFKDEHELFRKTVAAFIEREIAPNYEAWEKAGQASREVWRKAGADVQGERVRMPRGLCRQLIQASAPREFTQHARNPARDVRIGGPHTVFAPAYGSPFVHNLDEGRRYARIDDFRNFVKLAYQSKSLHHSGGTICEPVLRPFRRLIPPIGALDLSALWAMLALGVLLRLLHLG